MKPSRRTSPARCAGAILCFKGVLVGAAGCYEHVTSASGFQTGDVDVHEPNLRDDRPVENLIFGEPTTEQRDRRRPR